MWFYDEEAGDFYWLTSSEDRNNTPAPERLPMAAESRPIQEGEWIWDVFTCFTADGRTRVEFRWICSENFVEAKGEEPKAEYPRQVTIQNLAQFFKSTSQKSTTIRLNEHTNITRNADFSGFSLSVKGTRFLGWGAERLYWYRHGNLSQFEVEALEKFLGTAWKMIPKDDVVGLFNKNTGWVAASEFGEFTIDGRQTSNTYVKEIVNPELVEYARLLKTIQKYVDQVTPAKIKAVTDGMTVATHAITTRCEDCQSCNGIHLEVHMAREELDPYLIYSAFDAFGPEQFGGALRQTWDLIADPNLINVNEFKGYLKNFLIDTLRIKTNALAFMPLNRRKECNTWRLYAQGRMRVDGGIRLVAGRGENEGMRDGEWLARENQANRPALEERNREREREMARLMFRDRLRQAEPAAVAGRAAINDWPFADAPVPMPIDPLDEPEYNPADNLYVDEIEEEEF